MYRIVINPIKKYIRGWFLLHLLLNLLANSFVIPTLMVISNKAIIGNDIQYGILILFGFLIVTLCVDRHNLNYLDPYKLSFRENAHKELEEFITKKFVCLNWNKIKSLQKEFEMTKNKAKYPLLSLIDTFVQRTISLFPFFGYILWLGIISPFSIIFYIVGITAIIYYHTPPPRDIEVYHDIWERHDFLRSGRFTDIIHNRGIQNKDEMIECIMKSEQQSNTDRLRQLRHIQRLTTAFNIIFGINLVFFVLPMSNIYTVITYIQYTYMIRTNVVVFGDFFKQYKEAQCEYDKLNDILLKCTEREIVPMIDNFETIIIKDLTYAYPRKDEKQDPFVIQAQTPIEMKRGQIIRLVGDTGDGKSSFMDIVCAIIPYKELTHDIYYDGCYNMYGFDAISTQRFYVEQFECVDWDPCVYEIVTGKHIVISSDSFVVHLNSAHANDEELFWQAIQMAHCSDFLKRYNEENTLKWIYTKNIDPSGGQKGRIRIARILYNMLKERPAMIVLDEIDTAFQGELGIKIMSTIFDYCQKNHILCLVSAHSTEVKNMHYDAHIHFDKGTIQMLRREQFKC